MTFKYCQLEFRLTSVLKGVMNKFSSIYMCVYMQKVCVNLPGFVELMRGDPEGAQNT